MWSKSCKGWQNDDKLQTRKCLMDKSELNQDILLMKYGKIIRDVTRSVDVMERALIEQRMERSKLQVTSQHLINHIWELDIVEDYYLGLDTTVKRS